jgi:hypothetical protein
MSSYSNDIAIWKLNDYKTVSALAAGNTIAHSWDMSSYASDIAIWKLTDYETVSALAAGNTIAHS